MVAFLVWGQHIRGARATGNPAWLQEHRGVMGSLSREAEEVGLHWPVVTLWRGEGGTPVEQKRQRMRLGGPGGRGEEAAWGQGVGQRKRELTGRAG